MSHDPKVPEPTRDELALALANVLEAYDADARTRPFASKVLHTAVAEARKLLALVPPREVESGACPRCGGIGRLLLKHAMKHAGVNYLECLGEGLRKLYEDNGFSVENTYPFDPDMAPSGWNEAKFGRPNYYTLTRSPMEFTGPPKTAEEAKARRAEMEAATPDEIRAALIRAIKRERPGITQSEIDAEMMIVEATFGVNF